MKNPAEAGGGRNFQWGVCPIVSRMTTLPPRLVRRRFDGIVLHLTSSKRIALINLSQQSTQRVIDTIDAGGNILVGQPSAYIVYARNVEMLEIIKEVNEKHISSYEYVVDMKETGLR